MSGAFSMRSPRVALLVLVLPVALAACGGGGGSAGKAAGNVVGVVGSDTITREEFEATFDQARRAYEARGDAFPKAGTPEYQQLQGQAMGVLVQRSEYAQKARELGIVITEKEIEERLQQIKKQYFGGNEAEYRKQLVQQGLTDRQVREDVVRPLLVSEAIFAKVTAGIEVTDAEVSEYYLQHSAQYTRPQSREVRHILVKSKALADKIYAQLKDGADFAALAKRYSTDPGSKSLGGKLTISKGETVPEFDKVAFSLKTGQIAKPVKSTYGWHVIQALKPVKPRQTTPLKEVKEAIRQQLLEQRRSEAMTNWVEDVKKEFCAGKLEFQAGFSPVPDPCADLSAAPSPTTP